MLIEITKEQLNELNALSTFSNYYLDMLDPSNEVYQDDKNSIVDGQKVLTYLYKQFLEASK
jgi:hypothetical protein